MLTLLAIVSKHGLPQASEKVRRSFKEEVAGREKQMHFLLTGDWWRSSGRSSWRGRKETASPSEPPGRAASAHCLKQEADSQSVLGALAAFRSRLAGVVSPTEACETRLGSSRICLNITCLPGEKRLDSQRPDFVRLAPKPGREPRLPNFATSRWMKTSGLR